MFRTRLSIRSCFSSFFPSCFNNHKALLFPYYPRVIVFSSHPLFSRLSSIIVLSFRFPPPLLHFHTLSIFVIFTHPPHFYLSLSLCLWRPVSWQMCVENSFWQLGHSSHLSSWPPEYLCLREAERRSHRRTQESKWEYQGKQLLWKEKAFAFCG